MDICVHQYSVKIVAKYTSRNSHGVTINIEMSNEYAQFISHGWTTNLLTQARKALRQNTVLAKMEDLLTCPLFLKL